MRHMRIIVVMLSIMLLAGGAAPSVYALTAAEALALKKAGVTDETIRLMIQQQKEGKRPADDAPMGKREIRDSKGDVSIEYSTGGSRSQTGANAQQQADKAWEMLRHLIVDTRSTK